MISSERDARHAARNEIRRKLWQWGGTMEKIRRLEQERDFYRRRVDDARVTLKSPDFSGMPKGGKSSDLSDVIVGVMREAERYERQLGRIDAEIAAALEHRNRMQDCISRLTPIQEKIITYRYGDGYNWRYIAIKTNYDEASVRRIDAQSADAIAAMLENA